MQSSGYRSVAIIGDGGMGTVLSILLCEKDIPTRMWGYEARQLAGIERDRENKRFLPGYQLPDSLAFEARDDRAMAGVELIVSAIPCQYMRPIWNRLRQHVPAGTPIVSVAKGIENGTLLRPTQILSGVLGTGLSLAALSGPTIADELARKLPATACAAAEDEALAQRIQATFTCPWLRVYTNTDLIGVELAGAMKNVIAIAAGIIDGVGAGDNAKAALLARGLAEITRLGLAMGAHENTFAGLTGLGDLVTTCISPTGRNRSFGERIGKGLTSGAGTGGDCLRRRGRVHVQIGRGAGGAARRRDADHAGGLRSALRAQTRADGDRRSDDPPAQAGVGRRRGECSRQGLITRRRSPGQAGIFPPQVRINRNSARPDARRLARRISGRNPAASPLTPLPDWLSRIIGSKPARPGHRWDRTEMLLLFWSCATSISYTLNDFGQIVETQCAGVLKRGFGLVGPGFTKGGPNE